MDELLLLLDAPLCFDFNKWLDFFEACCDAPLFIVDPFPADDDDDDLSGEMGTGSAGRECDKLDMDLLLLIMEAAAEETSGIGWPITFGA